MFNRILFWTTLTLSKRFFKQFHCIVLEKMNHKVSYNYISAFIIVSYFNCNKKKNSCAGLLKIWLESCSGSLQLWSFQCLHSFWVYQLFPLEIVANILNMARQYFSKISQYLRFDFSIYICIYMYCVSQWRPKILWYSCMSHLTPLL